MLSWDICKQDIKVMILSKCGVVSLIWTLLLCVGGYKIQFAGFTQIKVYMTWFIWPYVARCTLWAKLLKGEMPLEHYCGTMYFSAKWAKGGTLLEHYYGTMYPWAKWTKWGMLLKHWCIEDDYGCETIKCI